MKVADDISGGTLKCEWVIQVKSLTGILYPIIQRLNWTLTVSRALDMKMGKLPNL